MHITFAPKDEAYLKGLVEAGYYTNMTEAIRDAVRRMRDTYTQTDPFVEAVAKGVRSLEAGKVVSYTPELMETIRKKAIESADNGKPVSSDVIPQ